MGSRFTLETNIDALWKTFELSRNDNTSKSSSVFYFSYDMIEKTIRLIIFVGRNELLEKQIKAKRCKWHSCQIITSKSGNSPKVLCIRHKQELSRFTEKLLFAKYPEVDWKGAMGMRDIIAHHYFDLDAAVVYDVVKNYLPFMLATIKKIRKEL